MAANVSSASGNSPGRSHTGLAQYPLLEVILRIVLRSDADALEELLSRRPLFRGTESRALLLADYIDRLWAQALSRKHREATAILDAARDLCQDKFSNLPSGSDSLKRHGPDCRLYYSAFVKRMERRNEADASVSGIAEEFEVARELQRFVTRHFHLSVLEARRAANPLVSRYAWDVGGNRTITVWLPKTMKSGERRKWLEEHVDVPDPSLPGERERVQAMIDSRIVRGGLVPFETIRNILGAQGQGMHLKEEGQEEEERSLSALVAEEKALAVDLQRPAIRALGPRKLKALVLALFENATGREQTEEQLAHQFGLSKSTLSRFAGSRWDREAPDKDGAIPDLWLNVAHVLALDPHFAAVAQRAGVFDDVRALVLENDACRLRDYGHAR